MRRTRGALFCLYMTGEAFTTRQSTQIQRITVRTFEEYEADFEETVIIKIVNAA